MKKPLFLLLLLTIVLQTRAQDMPHGEGFDMDCALCHGTESWRVDPANIKFDHNATGFPLVGAHSKQLCGSCHQSLVFQQIGTACADCHQDVHKGELGIRCQDCHTPVNWENRLQVFEQHQQTDFPLLGRHALIDCGSCHRQEQGREFTGLSVECKSCHLTDYMSTLNPAHIKAGLDLNCQACHLPNALSWKNAVYQHPEIFRLDGAHATLECIDCHSQQYTGLPQDCFACHDDDYNRATEPNHLVFGFPTVCEQCHQSDSWQATSFDHLSVSGFALEGAHSGILCTDCHVNNQLTGLPRDCYGCHATDFQTVKDPDHVAGGFSEDCLTCHSLQTWSPADFDHDQTDFPLTGAHVSTACQDCHVNGYAPGQTLSECVSCHQSDYDGTTSPNHSEAGIQVTCQDCHNTSGWTPAEFDHSQTAFALTGAHVSVPCQECHVNGYSAGQTLSECVSCHQSDYDNTSDPDHQAAQFPVTCQDCHSTSAWKPADWDHDGQYFPIYSGKHQNEWDVCADCHVNSSDYTQFECINCHEHSNQTDLADEHKEVANYEFNSAACYDCHPRGVADDD